MEVKLKLKYNKTKLNDTHLSETHLLGEELLRGRPPRAPRPPVLPGHLVGLQLHLLGLDQLGEGLGVLVDLGAGLVEVHGVLGEGEQVVLEGVELAVLLVLDLGGDRLQVRGLGDDLVVLRVPL